MLRAIVMFLVGAGVMLGAFLTGVAQRVPQFFSQYSQYGAPTDLVPVPRDQVAAMPDEQDASQPVEMAQVSRPEFLVQVEAPSGDFDTSGCSPSYRFSNDTGVPVAFETDAEGGSVAVPPGGVAGPQPGVNDCGPIVRIKLVR